MGSTRSGKKKLEPIERFKHRLALALGVADVGALDLLTENQLLDWQLFDREEPIGTRELRIQMAQLCSFMGNFVRAKDTQPYHRDDFLLSTPAAAQERKFNTMLGTLNAVARPRPPGWKNKRPGHVSKAERKRKGKKR